MGAWADNTVFWHVYPLGFCGAPLHPQHNDDNAAPRLHRLTNWLDYATTLGVNGLLLAPIFAAQSHGYDSIDQFRIDPRLGTEQDFMELVTQAKARDLHIVLDGVFSHVGSDHPWLQEALATGPDGPHGDLFDIDWGADGEAKPHVWEGHNSLARLNHASESAVDYVYQVMTYWLARGVSGWRLDAAYSVAPAFWDRVLPRVQEQFPDAFFLGEVIHGDYPRFVAETGVDTVTQYELWKAVWSSLADTNLWELDAALTRHNGYLNTFIPQTFIGNHDVTRIASQVGPEKAIAALAILLTIGGIPSIYYGDEQGFTAVKGTGFAADDALRPEFPEFPPESYFSSEFFQSYRELIYLRRSRPWLSSATSTKIALTNPRYTYRITAPDNSDSLEVTIDLDANNSYDPNKPGTASGLAVTIRDSTGNTIWEYQRR